MDYKACNLCRRHYVDEKAQFRWDEDSIIDTDVGWFCPVLRRHIFKDDKDIPSKCIYVLEHLMIGQKF